MEPVTEEDWASLIECAEEHWARENDNEDDAEAA